MTYKKDMSRSEAEKLAEDFIGELNKIGFNKIEISGSLRRKEAIIGDIDIVVEGDISRLKIIPGADIKRGQELITLVYKGQQINVLRSTPEEWGAAQLYLTGPKGSTLGYRTIAKKKGWLLNSHGLFDEKGQKIAGETEEGIYIALGRSWKAPEKRGK